MSAAPLTPLLEQYAGVKARYPGHLVLFRVGDFYETFGDDAKLLSRELELTLTARAPDTRGERTPMAGVPHHAVENYLGRLIRKGYKVAVCDQVEDPKLAKGLVRREVTRVVTPGTVVEERILAGPEHSFLASLVVGAGDTGAIAVVDITTGEWFDAAVSGGLEALLGALAPFRPRELLYDAAAAELGRLDDALRTAFPAARRERAPSPMELSSLPDGLAGLRTAPPILAGAGARLAEYVRTTQPRLLAFLERREEWSVGRSVRLDPRTLRHLEVTAPMNPDDRESPTLLSTFDRTRTACGRRTIAFWLTHPLAELPAIVDRLDAVEALSGRGGELARARSILERVPDLSRIASRLAGRRLRPAELFALREGLGALAELQSWLGSPPASPLLEGVAASLQVPEALSTALRAGLPDVPPGGGEEEGTLRPGFDAEVDRLQHAEAQGLAELEALERREQERTGIRSLKIGYNQVFGYYLDVSRPNLARVPAEWRRKQTLSGGERFVTGELATLEERILSARDGLQAARAAAWERFLGTIEPSVPVLHRLNRAVGVLDTLAAFAVVARERGHIRPIVDESGELLIREGRHPVLESLLGREFVPNDTELGAEAGRVLLLTGPNMAGKSTYMRQVGLIVVLAQAGAFVPARYARVGLVTSLHTRMGFTDEIGRGKSSFMVEMSEVADILRAAGRSSLVLLDEVGRGTSTFDGVSVAWAVVRYLHDRTRARTIVATHYHQLTDLAAGLSAARNGHFAVREEGGTVVFLHRLVPGATDRSYGVHVARLAGLPPEVVKDSESLLRELEAGGLATPGAAEAAPRPRYTQAVLLPDPAVPGPSEIERAFDRLDPERMTPYEALSWLVDWKRRRPGAAPRGAP